jgi:hypothetical protein
MVCIQKMRLYSKYFWGNHYDDQVIIYHTTAATSSGRL